MSVAEPRMSAPRRMKLAAPIVALAVLGACSSPEKADAPGADKPFPNLATVPERPAGQDPRQRMEIQEGLFADRRNARYLDGGGPRAGYGRAPDRVTDSEVRAEIIRPGSAKREARVRTVDGVRIVRSGFIAAVTFAGKGTALPPGSGRKIVRIAQIQNVLESTLTLIGRSGRGEPADAALARARAVATGLTTMGVPAGKIRIRKGKGAASRVDVYMSGGKVPKQ
ncbi:MAG: hypothetical protein F4114_10150 [Rhodospirillaceae bacterium]|nr:hypothetical protein [Rhodospirillaceae bacterium]MCY4066945.1 hypothetical protein [Rhodospirillaceae bacterium]MXW90646.1 hypothetical protein [Rhodospirillaceae bacterium]MYB12968.1 hypothetical protein [Rhodospirillaceae bacterium]MYI49432.1 hypothetical protein [Rhodospirillaceae bacterium]